MTGSVAASRSASGARTCLIASYLALAACGPGGEPASERYAAQPTPELAWERFLELNERRVKETELGIYDERARELVRQRNGDAGQAHIARLYRNSAPTVRQRNDRAAVVFLDDPRQVLAPWFFKRSAAGWQLDGATQYNVVGYDEQNRWRFRNQIHRYMFAFDDFRFDARGYGRVP
ncbi:MAG: hypothetical protein PVF05_08505 [Gemmatimonadales bacterium]